MERSLFFNAVEIAPGVFDREYVESDFALYFGSVLSTGILSTEDIPSLSVSVEAGTLNTIVSGGMAIMRGHLYLNTTPLTLAHSMPEATLDRIDRIVLRYDVRNQTRDINAFVKEGLPSAAPVPPDLQRDNFIHEISLAQIRVRKNTVQLLPADLKDERLDEDLCGLVTWTPKVPTEQFQRQWDEFMAGIEDEGFATVASVQAVDTKVTTHLADYVSHPANGGTTAGTATAYTCNSLPNPTALVDKIGVVITVHIDSGANPTLKWGSLAAKPIKKPNGNAANLKKDGLYSLRYNLVNDSFILLGEGGEYGDAAANDVRLGKTVGTENGVITGTLNLTNLTPSNIKKNVNVGGVVGTLEILGPGDTIIYPTSANNTVTPKTPTSYLKLMTNVAATYRVSYSLGDGEPAYPVFGQLYVGGSPAGLLRQHGSYGNQTRFTEDIFIPANTSLDLMGWLPDRNTRYGQIGNLWIGITSISITKLGGV